MRRVKAPSANLKFIRQSADKISRPSINWRAQPDRPHKALPPVKIHSHLAGRISGKEFVPVLLEAPRVSWPASTEGLASDRDSIRFDSFRNLDTSLAK